jgi:3-methyladenine DNA glycosylase AlkD
MMATHIKTAKGEIDSLNRYGIADAARTRITAQILRNVTRPTQKQQIPPAVPQTMKMQKQA